MKKIDYVTIFGQQTMEDARLEAGRLAGDQMTVIAVAGQTVPFETSECSFTYFVYPKGQRCPCCGRE